MKTNIHNSKTGLPGRSEQVNTAKQGNQNPNPIDSAKRRENRKLSTDAVLAALAGTVPELMQIVQVVGSWVWLEFDEAPEAVIRQKISQLGFHWNNQRMAWQHPCGKFSLGASYDPREKYPTRYATQPAS
jgi:hypothetical protein